MESKIEELQEYVKVLLVEKLQSNREIKAIQLMNIYQELEIMKDLT